MKKFGKGIVAVAALVFGVYEFYDDFLATSDFGESLVVDGTEIFYSDVDTTLIRELGDFLVLAEFTDGTEKSLRLQKLDDGYAFGGVYEETIWNDSSYLDSGLNFAMELSLYVFDSKPVTFQLCDEEFEVQNQVVFDISDFPYGWEQDYGNTQLFFTSRVDYTDANKLGAYLESQGFTEFSATVQLDKSDSAYHFKQVTNEDFWYDEEYLASVQTSALELSDSVFNGVRVIYSLCDDELQIKASASSD